MTIADYANSVRAFARDTAEWGGLDPYRYYTATGSAPFWEETGDNAHGGINVSWAFHRLAITDEEIHKAYMTAWADMVRLAEDDEWDEEQRAAIRETFEDVSPSDLEV